MLNTSSHSSWGRWGMLATGHNTGPATLGKATLHLSVNPCLGTSLYRSTEMPRWEETGGLWLYSHQNLQALLFSWALTHPAFPQQLRSSLVLADLSLTAENYSKELFLSLFYWGGNKGSERFRNTQKVKEEACDRGRSCICPSRSRTKFLTIG